MGHFADEFIEKLNREKIEKIEHELNVFIIVTSLESYLQGVFIDLAHYKEKKKLYSFK